jgi:EamA domain-containing membrane protein RarD
VNAHQALTEVHLGVRALLKEHHAPAQASRFAITFAAALWLQVRGGATVTGWSDLVALLLGAAHIAYRQWRKTLPVPAVLKLVADTKTDAHNDEQREQREPQTG